MKINIFIPVKTSYFVIFTSIFIPFTYSLGTIRIGTDE